jgi:hypothetical protein
MAICVIVLFFLLFSLVSCCTAVGVSVAFSWVRVQNADDEAILVNVDLIESGVRHSVLVRILTIWYGKDLFRCNRKIILDATHASQSMLWCRRPSVAKESNARRHYTNQVNRAMR